MLYKKKFFLKWKKQTNFFNIPSHKKFKKQLF